MRRFVVSIETQFSPNNTLILLFYLKTTRQYTFGDHNNTTLTVLL